MIAFPVVSYGTRSQRRPTLRVLPSASSSWVAFGSACVLKLADVPMYRLTPGRAPFACLWKCLTATSVWSDRWSVGTRRYDSAAATPPRSFTSKLVRTVKPNYNQSRKTRESNIKNEVNRNLSKKKCKQRKKNLWNLSPALDLLFLLLVWDEDHIAWLSI